MGDFYLSLSAWFYTPLYELPKAPIAVIRFVTKDE
jgi:hypothetical protein